jgi:hypothetical protein
VNQTTKNQHYVPKFLLKNFTFSEVSDKVKRIKLYSMEKDKVIYQPIDNTFSQNFFYDNDNKIENGINGVIESMTAPIINDLLKNENIESLNIESKQSLLTFICHQTHRTRQSYEEVIQLSDIVVDKMFNEIQKELFGFIDDDIIYEVSKEYKRYLLNYNCAVNYFVSLCINDLSLHLLINHTNEEFICSDNPSIQYNWYFQNNSSTLSTSPFSAGTQFFMPISPKIYLCYYDANIYKYGKNKNSNISYLIEEKDVDWLNKMQIMNSFNYIAYRYNADIHIKNLCSKTKLKIFNIYGDDMGSILGIHKKIVGNIEQPNFFKVLKSSRNKSLCFRNSALVEKYNRLIKQFLPLK